VRSAPLTFPGLALGGVDANELARVYGTPLLVLDGERLDAAIAPFLTAQHELGIEVSYAGKALLVVPLARRIAAAGLDIDVCSLGELLTAERAGVTAAKLTLHGCGKTDEELRAACAGRVRRIVVDDLEEIARLAAIARGTGCRADVLVRVNTGLEAHTHAYVRTGGEDSKFGVPFAALDEALGAVAAQPALRLAGVHSHIGSQIFEAEAFLQNVPLALDAFARALRFAPEARAIVLGGGFGVDSHPGGERLDIGAVLRDVAQTIARLARERELPPPEIGIEPGRAIVADAGTSLYRVVSVKQNGTRRFAIVDGGIADNPRPALYGAYHHPVLAGRRSQSAPRSFAICGRSCESDRLVDADLPGDLQAGDLLALETTGAYTYSMASNYNRFCKPAVALAEHGTHRVFVRRETVEDLLANDVDDVDTIESHPS
jgi:diaminopimelate decarboxylase